MAVEADAYVELSEWEQRRCVGTAKMIREASVSAGHRERHGLDPERGEAMQVQGDCGEQALAKFLDLYHPVNLGTYGGPDLSHEIQVRCSRRSQLIVRKGDNAYHRFVLVVPVGDGRFRISGWLYGWEAAQERWLDNPHERGAAYFVPEGFLRPIQELREIILTEKQAAL